MRRRSRTPRFANSLSLASWPFSTRWDQSHLPYESGSALQPRETYFSGTETRSICSGDGRMQPWTTQCSRESCPRYSDGLFTLAPMPMRAAYAISLCRQTALRCFACCLATERGIRICAPVHDALLIEAPLEELDATAAATQQAMEEASSIVLSGFKLRSEAKIVRFPDRYEDERGKAMWNRVWETFQERVR